MSKNSPSPSPSPSSDRDYPPIQFQQHNDNIALWLTTEAPFLPPCVISRCSSCVSASTIHRAMTASTFFCSILFTIICILNLPAIVGAGSMADYIPITYTINQKRTECIYDRFETSDFVTFSAFVVDAMNHGPLKATISFEGPVAGNDAVLKKVEEASAGAYGKKNKNTNINNNNNDKPPNVGRLLKTGSDRHWPLVRDADKGVRYDKRMGIINRSVKVDWSHAGESEDAKAMRQQISAERKEAYRNYGRGGPEGELTNEMKRLEEKFRVVTQVKIEPFQETNAIKAPGWYRLCVASEMHTLLVEMDIRSGNKMGGVDRSTGHVFTYEKRALLDDEKRLEEEDKDPKLNANTYPSISEERQKEIDNQVRHEDLHATTSQIKNLNSMVMEMKMKYQDVNNRIRSHKASAERNQDNLIWKNKLLTVLYVMITLFQVHTMRKWLLSNKLLGT
mmetsp:Transcript_45466/g.95437  ORF Transcript_45466/g.95437 Transcript_45466/m.95437 type:complete len:449 (+) Transcript_45466:1128-2474(+)